MTMLQYYTSVIFFFFLMIRRPPRSTHCISSAASDVYKRQGLHSSMSILNKLHLNHQEQYRFDHAPNANKHNQNIDQSPLSNKETFLTGLAGGSHVNIYTNNTDQSEAEENDHQQEDKIIKFQSKKRKLKLNSPTTKKAIKNLGFKVSDFDTKDRQKFQKDAEFNQYIHKVANMTDSVIKERRRLKQQEQLTPEKQTQPESLINLSNFQVTCKQFKFLDNLQKTVQKEERQFQFQSTQKVEDQLFNDIFLKKLRNGLELANLRRSQSLKNIQKLCNLHNKKSTDIFHQQKRKREEQIEEIIAQRLQDIKNNIRKDRSTTSFIKKQNRLDNIEKQQQFSMTRRTQLQIQEEIRIDKLMEQIKCKDESIQKNLFQKSELIKKENEERNQIYIQKLENLKASNQQLQQDLLNGQVSKIIERSQSLDKLNLSKKNFMQTRKSSTMKFQNIVQKNILDIENTKEQKSQEYLDKEKMKTQKLQELSFLRTKQNFAETQRKQFRIQRTLTNYSQLRKKFSEQCDQVLTKEIEHQQTIIKQNQDFKVAFSQIMEKRNQLQQQYSGLQKKIEEIEFESDKEKFLQYIYNLSLIHI
eukprot:TRINITY_DN1734_c0_g1_i2.p1 TRINITY_DN1734_c0_g1~~TRINITY_DN1734_c0_g1_i2.p1  ORF type:complete len:586 (+),score=140.36 TRINITY_DN1734_c0_g1_i2:47-1804(+)